MNPDSHQRSGLRHRRTDAVLPDGDAGLAEDFTMERVDLAPGDRLLLHSDGLLEARNPAGVFLDVDAAVAAESGTADDDELLDRLLGHADFHTHGQLGDDLALMVISRPP